MADMTNYHELTDLKHGIILPLVLEVRLSQDGGRAPFLLEAPGENPFLPLSELLEAASIPWIVGHHPRLWLLSHILLLTDS